MWDGRRWQRVRIFPVVWSKTWTSLNTTPKSNQGRQRITMHKAHLWGWINSPRVGPMSQGTTTSRDQVRNGGVSRTEEVKVVETRTLVLELCSGYELSSPLFLPHIQLTTAGTRLTT